MAHADPDEFFHFVSQLVKHPADLAVDSLAQDNSHARHSDRLHFFHSRALTVEHHAGEQLRRERWLPGAIERHFVFLFDFVTRVRHSLREVAIVRQDEEAFGLRIEPADIEKARELRGQEVEDRVARVGVGAGRNKPDGFVQDDVELAFATHQPAPDFDVISLGGLRAEVGADAAVDRDAAVGNQLIAMPPRTGTGGGEKTIQAHREKLRVVS